MRNFLIDSDILIDFFNSRKDAVELIDQISLLGKLYASILSLTELRSGWTREQADRYLLRFYKLVDVVDLGLKVAELAGKYQYKYKLLGKTIGTIDALIGATACVYDYQLVTRNVKDYPMPELKLYPGNT